MAAPSPTLNRLRQSLAGIDPSLAPRLAEDRRSLTLGGPIDRALGGGLAGGELHELAPSAPMHLAAAGGFATALAARASGARGEVLCVGDRFRRRGGRRSLRPGPRLVRPGDLSASLCCACRARPTCCGRWRRRCAAARSPASSPSFPATARRPISPRRAGFRLPRARARRSGCCCATVRCRHPSAAATRWQIAASPSRPDAFGGLGSARFDLTLCKNRRGPSGRWIVEWDHHERAFHAAVSVGVAETAVDRPDRAPLVRAG